MSSAVSCKWTAAASSSSCGTDVALAIGAVMLGRVMSQASATMAGAVFDCALVMLTGIIKDYPDYSEGWNQRATLYYMMGQLDASLDDIAKTLALEPRHFGALSGRVMIELKQGKRPEALKDMIAALAIDPYLETRKLFPELSQNTTNV